MSVTRQDAETSRSDERRWEFAVKQYGYVQSKIGAYDEVSFKIKSWAVTLWSLLIGFAVKDRFEFGVVLSGFSIFLFWLSDVQYKFFQEQFIKINAEIEDILNSETVLSVDMNRLLVNHRLSTTFVAHGRLTNEFRNVFRRFWFHTIYIGMLVLTIMVWLSLSFKLGR
jgi:hypothetical protein